MRKFPPAYKAGPVPSSYTTSEKTGPFIPLPSAVQLVPFHFATEWTTVPLAPKNDPPAYIARPLPSSNSVTVRTDPVRPTLVGDQFDAFQRANLFAGTLPA